ncbi:MAG: rhodanese-like domain-containing protein [Anaerocolumna sp.]
MTFETIRAKDIEMYIGRQGTLIVDIRDESDFRRGHIPTSINIPYIEIDNWKRSISIDLLLIFYCDRGNLSLLLARELSNEGYHVKNIYGGLNAYRGPLVR